MKRVVSVWLPHWPTDRFERLARSPQNASQNAYLGAHLGASGRTERSTPWPETSGASGPLVLAQMARGAHRVCALNASALALGLTRGAPVAEARARTKGCTPALRVGDWDAPGDQAGLAALARWAMRWSPDVAARCEVHDLWGVCDFGLGLDITGAAHLFGGEAGLGRDLLQRLDGLGVTGARLAVAPNFAAAWALARFADPPEAHLADADPVRARLIVAGTMDKAEALLAPAPIEALRLDEAAVSGLRALGLTCCGLVRAHIARPDGRDQLARRFSTRRYGGRASGGRASGGRASGGRPSGSRVLGDVLTRLDQVFANGPEPLEPLRPLRPMAVAARYGEPMLLREGLVAAAGDLAARLALRLDKAGGGARALVLTLGRVDGRRFEVRVGVSSPSAHAPHLARLLADRMERLEIDIGFGVDALRLTATHWDAVTHSQADLAVGDPSGRGGGGLGSSLTQADLTNAEAASLTARLADRLAARLGPERVARAERLDTWRPERRAVWRPAHAEPHPAACKSLHNTGDNTGDSIGDRAAQEALRGDPAGALLWRLAGPHGEIAEVMAETPDGPPLMFRWRARAHRVARARGPNRIAPDWWRVAPEDSGDPEDSGGPPLRDYFIVETVEGARFALVREGLYGAACRQAGQEARAPVWRVIGAGGAP